MYALTGCSCDCSDCGGSSLGQCPGVSGYRRLGDLAPTTGTTPVDTSTPATPTGTTSGSSTLQQLQSALNSVVNAIQTLFGLAHPLDQQRFANANLLASIAIQRGPNDAQGAQAYHKLRCLSGIGTTDDNAYVQAHYTMAPPLDWGQGVVCSPTTSGWATTEAKEYGKLKVREVELRWGIAQIAAGTGYQASPGAFLGLPPTTLLLIAAGAFLVLRRRGRR